MVDNVASLSRNGVRDWLIQRITAVVMAIYTIFLVGYIVSVDHLSYEFWHDLYHHNTVRILSFLVVLSIVFHAWIGLWTVYTDYIKSTALRFLLEVTTIVSLLALLAWGVVILWS
jgi:succinate dehydrogenase / fumarate reductase, membrane anchor subunit